MRIWLVSFYSATLLTTVVDVQLYANLIANHPVTRVTGNPFGSLDRLVATIDFESQTMDQIGEMESKIFYAMIPGGITGDMGEEMEKALAS